MITKHFVEQGSAEWLVLREGKYTGSNADRLLKFGAIKYSLNQAAQLFDTFWTKRGHLLEQESISIYEDIYHLAVERVGFITNTKYPTAGYSPDGMLPSMLLESKSYEAEKHLEIIKLKEPPFKELAQIHFGLTISELPGAHLIFYNPKVEPKFAIKIFDIKADPKIKANFKSILRSNNE